MRRICRANQRENGFEEIIEEEARDAHRYAVEAATTSTNDATYQAMEALVHNLNTMHSRAGAQVPFSSLNYGTDTSPEARMVIRNLLLATDRGLGDGETPIFPVQIFKVKEGVNYNEGDPNYDLFQLRARSAPSACSRISASSTRRSTSSITRRATTTPRSRTWAAGPA